jgi:DNA-directed RNA polymerase specialized sigma24 family protein
MSRRSPLRDDCTDSTTTPVYEAYSRHQSSLKQFIGRLILGSSDIEDIAQEAFLRAYCVERGRPIEQPKSFPFRIAKHIALSQLKRKARHGIRGLVGPSGGDDGRDLAP